MDDKLGCMPYFNPTINFNVLYYISSSAFQISNSQQVYKYFKYLLAALLIDLGILLYLKD